MWFILCVRKSLKECLLPVGDHLLSLFVRLEVIFRFEYVRL